MTNLAGEDVVPSMAAEKALVRSYIGRHQWIRLRPEEVLAVYEVVERLDAELLGARERAAGKDAEIERLRQALFAAERRSMRRRP